MTRHIPQPRRDGKSASLELRAPLMSVRGAAPGPRLVVTGPDMVIRELAGMLWDIDGIDRIRGSLILRVDSQSPQYDLPDAILEFGAKYRSAHRALSRVLVRMAALNMTEGDSVPNR